MAIRNHYKITFAWTYALADTIQINGDRVSVTTRHPIRLMNRIPQLFQESGIVVNELTSGDESLQELFNTIMKIHRGEL